MPRLSAPRDIAMIDILPSGRFCHFFGRGRRNVVRTCTSNRANRARRLIHKNLLRFLTSQLFNCHRLVRHSFSLRNISGPIMLPSFKYLMVYHTLRAHCMAVLVRIVDRIQRKELGRRTSGRSSPMEQTHQPKPVPG